MKQCYCDASDEIVFENDCKNCCLLRKQDLGPDEVSKCCFYSELTECGGGLRCV